MTRGTGTPLPGPGMPDEDAGRGDSGLASTGDELLSPFLSSPNADEARAKLGDLLEQHLNPVIRRTIRRRLQLLPGTEGSGQDAEDLYGEAVARLLDRLQTLRAAGAPAEFKVESGPSSRKPATGIINLAGYVATIASNVCDEYLRRKYPERRRLKNRVQYLLTHRADFSLWEGKDGEWYGGFGVWNGRCAPAGSGDRIRHLREQPAAFEKSELGGRRALQEDPVKLVSAIFRWVGEPVELDTLVNVLRDLWEIQAETADSADGERALDRHAVLAARGPDIADQLDRRDFLTTLWSEICDLPPRQRCAVLLNLRDENGCSAIELFPLLAVATIRQIGAALEIAPEEFALLWNELPLDDARIAARLGVTRQQVINLRKSARERLSRRVQGS